MKKALYLAMIGSMAALFTLTPASAQTTGAKIYKAKCEMCHGADGSGSTPAGKMMKAIPFKSPELVKKTDAELIHATENGKGHMPAYKSKLTDAQIKDVIGYIRTLQKKK
ncbi:MAG TPA: cytochrome c [Acidobacteriaceae bacterium]|nr:cytochrome c [Acidobacteriaceae bacterium]